jgi:5-hydroxyisourate hydrolase
MTLSTHVLDAVRGRPAHGLRVRWDTLRDGEWAAAGSGATGTDGRIAEWTTSGTDLGIHRLVFDTGEWFRGEGRESFYPEVVVIFEVQDAEEHHHVPLLLSPHSYTTYRGS